MQNKPMIYFFFETAFDPFVVKRYDELIYRYNSSTCPWKMPKTLIRTKS